jgi:K+-transporting ATPase ATPase B chain
MDEKTTEKKRGAFDRALVWQAIMDAFKKLDPRVQIRNPVMFVVGVGALLTVYYIIHDAVIGKTQFLGLNIQIAIWLWITVLFANFAEAMAEGRGKAQAESLRKARKETVAKKLVKGEVVMVSASDLRKEDIVLIEAGDMVPGDGEIIEGIASVDESVITGESAPVIRESGGDRSSVTGGSTVLSDWIKVRISANPGESFLDHMISLVEGARRQKTPNEVALTILLVALTIIFVLVCASLEAFAVYSKAAAPVPTLIALAVCLIPTTIGGLLSAIGIAGMDRVLRHNVLAMSGKAVEAAGDVNVLLLDKTGTITLGNRMAVEFAPAPGVSRDRLADVAQLASLSDETPEGRSIVVLAKEEFAIRERALEPGMEFIPFTAQTRMSGVDYGGNVIRKGAADAVQRFVESQGGEMPEQVHKDVERIGKEGGTPLVVSEGRQVLGTIYLKDVVKGGMKERFAELRRSMISWPRRPPRKN